MTIRKASITKLVFGIVVSSAIAGAQMNVSRPKVSGVLSPAAPREQAKAVASADAAVSPTGVTPCTVTLFSNVAFATYDPQFFQYTPTCPGPWSKVIFQGSFNVSAGIQYDRTANIQLGFVNIYFGTTEEPSPTSAPAWNVQRDLTDYSALFTTAQSGEADIFNIVNSTDTGIIYGTATLQFYPATNGHGPVVADAVYPMPDATGAPYHLNVPTDQLAATFTLPTNVQGAYLDVIAQGQQTDEFWYSCVPTDVMAELESCGGTPFRETEITIDGTPAGVAPIYPWIFTGGIDPYLWAPIPGVQTLNFTPYRVNLTPFAGLLSNGQPHTIALSVFNANNYFQATGTLLVYLDHGSTQVTGDVTVNTIGSGPNPGVIENLFTDPMSGAITGDVTVTSTRAFTVSGYVNTSQGAVQTTVSQDIDYANVQQFDISSTTYQQDIAQNTIVHSTVTTTTPSGASEIQSEFSFPLSVNLVETLNADGTYSYVPTIDQVFKTFTVNGNAVTYQSNEVTATDTLTLDSSGNITGEGGQRSTSTMTAKSPRGCVGMTLTAANGQYTSATPGTGCPSK